MRLSIGIFAARPSCDYIREALQEQPNFPHQFTFYPYASLRELLDLYQAHAGEFQGIVFSGYYPYQYICARCGIPQTPSTYFELDHRDYYRVLLSVTYRNRGLDIRRVWLDTPILDIPWSYIFGSPDARPQSIGFWPDLTADDYYEQALDAYLQAYRSRQVDFIITRMTNLSDRLTREGVPHALLFPSPSSVWETVEKLAKLIQSRRVQDSLSAVGFLQPAQGMALDALSQLHTWIYQFNKENGGKLIILQTTDRFELLTPNASLLQLTQSYTCCALSDYIRTHCGVPFYTGWGVGADILQAQQNASSALKESRNSPSLAPFLITQENRLIGPLGQPECRTCELEPGQDARVLAKKIGVSLSTAQRMLSLYGERAEFRLTRNDLSRYLNTSARTANRILTRLTEVGAARIVATEKSGSAGRPISVFQLNLQSLY
ncbi:MAG: hypothetical protein HFF39_09830 [Lawsonibacter sp.]|nr:hypothetical protein [Lawsonibacter sp.]